MFFSAGALDPSVLTLHLRTRSRLFAGRDEWDEAIVEKMVPVSRLALLLCDFWNDHWCAGAARRVEAMAPAVEATISSARRQGIQIIHAPSDTMAFYEDSPFRLRIQAIPRLTPPEPLDLPDPPLPIDDSDGGCDSGEKPWHRAWTRQHPAITIAGDDVISDDGIEVYSLLGAKGIDTLLIAGVHTNMCVLKRSFAIKQMTRWGIHCVLVRDLTDTMYNPERWPFVSHEAGTQLVVEYIERYWCPSILSADLRL